MSDDSQFESGSTIFWIISACAAFGAAYWLWPEGISGIPVANLTLPQLAGLAGSAVSALIGGGAFAGAINDADKSF